MNKIGKLLIYIALFIFGLSMIVPFIWMITTALRSQIEVNKGNVGFIPIDSYTVYVDEEGNEFPVTVIPLTRDIGDSSYVHVFDEYGQIERAYLKVPNASITETKRLRLHWENFVNAWNKVPFGRYFLNTIFVSLTIMVGSLVTACLAAYAFAKMQFFGRETLFSFFLGMMMVPQPIYLIPSYVLLNKLGWIDSYYALIVPWLVHSFTIFLLRQHFKNIPNDLFDAAEIDGCSRFGILWRIVIPISKPILITAGLFSIIFSWNSFMWPLIMTNSQNVRVLQVGLSYFSQESSTFTTLLMAASTFSILPLVILFIFAQKKIIGSFASAGLKEG